MLGLKKCITTLYSGGVLEAQNQGLSKPRIALEGQSRDSLRPLPRVSQLQMMAGFEQPEALASALPGSFCISLFLCLFVFFFFLEYGEPGF